MNSSLETATLTKNKLFLRYFSRTLVKVLKDFFHTTPLSKFVVKVNRLSTVFYHVNDKCFLVFLSTMDKMTLKKVKLFFYCIKGLTRLKLI